MITKSQACRLRSLIVGYEAASLEKTWSRGGDPADWDQIDAEYVTATEALKTYIKHLTEKTK